MSTTLTLTSTTVARDIQSFLGRARRIIDGNTRIVAGDGYAQCYVGVLMPRGLLDQTPTVLGLRVAEIPADQHFDHVVPIESMVHRIEQAIAHAESRQGATQTGHTPVEVELPTAAPSIQWPAMTPPREGWKRRMGITSSLLKDVAKKGIEAISEAIPDSVGESVLQKVRSEVWGQPIPHKKSIPWAAGFAADALGLLEQRSLAVHTSGYWVRLSSHHGYVLVKAKSEPEELGEPDPND
ncbi:hypothetical protein [Pontimonas sp.]|uniref:hypothetical protein n=1 Tax=Pontimonas sp. TaxID=2304492 RepID=UPI00286FF10E|nr:hypothetical protein [Pontimonas sp.]MDR9395980.1 hypothetical protein [Pontimonas sp.]